MWIVSQCLLHRNLPGRNVEALYFSSKVVGIRRIFEQVISSIHVWSIATTPNYRASLMYTNGALPVHQTAGCY